MTGSRDGMTDNANHVLQNFLISNDIFEAHHGDCIGADTIFHNKVAKLKIPIIIHPPNNPSLRSYCVSNKICPEKEYMDRNRDIVDDSDILLAFPLSEKEVLRSGTWSTIRYARKTNKKIFIILSDGKIIKENY